MNAKVQNVEAGMMIFAGLAVLYGAYKVSSGAGKIASGAIKTVSDVVDGVADSAKSAVNKVQTAYAEVRTVITGNQYYGPSALDAGMSKGDAIKLADQILARDQREADKAAADIANQSSGWDAMGNPVGGYHAGGVN